MGYVYAEIQLKNSRLPELKPVEVKALVDTGALMLCIPEHLSLQLQLEVHSQREITTADGKNQLVPYVGPIEVRFDNRSCFVGALVSTEAEIRRPSPQRPLSQRERGERTMVMGCGVPKHVLGPACVVPKPVWGLRVSPAGVVPKPVFLVPTRQRQCH